MSTITLDKTAVSTMGTVEAPAQRRRRPSHHWMPWTGAGRLCTAAEEAALRADIEAAAAGETAPVRRCDITAVMNLLRCGMTFELMQEQAPGLQPARLVAAWDQIESVRARSAAAWVAIVESGDPAALDEHGPDAAILMPRLVATLAEARRLSSQRYATILDEMRDANKLAAEEARAVDQMMAAAEPGTDHASELGCRLYDGDGSGIASWPTFVADRVGVLAPLRVAAICGELPAANPTLD